MSEMLDQFSLSRFIQIGMSAIAIGISIRIFVVVWRHFWSIEVGARESGALAGAAIVFFIIWGMKRGPGVAGLSAELIVVGYFLVKLIKKYTG